MTAKGFLVFLLLFSAFGPASARVTIDSDTLTIIERGRLNEFTGNVRIRGDGFSVDSAKAVSDRQTGIITASGDVFIKYSTDTFNLEGWCSEARIDDERKKFYLYSDVKTVYAREDGDSAVMYADAAEVEYAAPRRAVYTGSVILETGEVRVDSERSVYSEETRSIVFTGSPTAVSRTGDTVSEYSGRVIRVHLDDERISVEGEARTRVWLENESQM